MKKVDLPGLDANGGPCYIGSGCFHRRKALCGMKYSDECERMEERDRQNGKRKCKCIRSIVQGPCKL